MNKKFGQFALPVLLFAFAGTAQAEEVYFGQWGSSFFTTDPWEVYYVDSTLPEFSLGGYKSMAEATSSQWISTGFREYPDSGFISNQGLFDLDAMWLAGAWGSQTLTITTYLNGVEQSWTTVDVTPVAQQFFFTGVQGFQGIDQFIIASAGTYVDAGLGGSGANWALGSVTVTAVPEPEAYAMLLAGLGLVGVMARRRRRS
jgi:hypothetical protein